MGSPKKSKDDGIDISLQVHLEIGSSRDASTNTETPVMNIGVMKINISHARAHIHTLSLSLNWCWWILCPVLTLVVASTTRQYAACLKSLPPPSLMKN